MVYLARADHFGTGEFGNIRPRWVWAEGILYLIPGREGTRMPHSDERPLGEEVSSLIGEIRRLLRLEIELARTELSPKLAHLGRHLAVMVIGGVIACIGFLAFVISAIMGLARVVPPWLAAFIAGVFLAGGGALLIIRGKKGVDRETIVPEKTVESLKEAAQRVKEELK